MLASASCKNDFCTLVALAVLKVLHTKFIIKFLTSFCLTLLSLHLFFHFQWFQGRLPKKYYPKLTALCLCTNDVTNFQSLLWLRHWTWSVEQFYMGKSHLPTNLRHLWRFLWLKETKSSLFSITYILTIINVCQKTRLNIENPVMVVPLLLVKCV